MKEPVEHILASLTLGDEDEANMSIALPSEDSPHVLNFHVEGEDPYEEEDSTSLEEDPDDWE